MTYGFLELRRVLVQALDTIQFLLLQVVVAAIAVQSFKKAMSGMVGVPSSDILSKGVV